MMSHCNQCDNSGWIPDTNPGSTSYKLCWCTNPHKGVGKLLTREEIDSWDVAVEFFTKVRKLEKDLSVALETIEVLRKYIDETNNYSNVRWPYTVT